MGYTALRALARALERRAKHAYAVLVLDVCVAILRLRDDSNERRKLQRELCIVSTRQGDRETGVTHCNHVLGDLRERFEGRRIRALAHQTSLQDNKRLGLIQVLDSIIIADVYEVFFVAELLVTHFAKSSDLTYAHLTLQNLEADLSGRQKMCATSTSIYELELASQQAALSVAHIAVEQCEPSLATFCLERALAVCPTSHRRRIAFLSYLIEAHVLCDDTMSAQLALRRVERIRQHASSGSLARSLWNPLEDLCRGEYQPLWDSPLKGRLVAFCDNDVDLGQLAAEVALLERRPRRALKRLVPTVAAAEAAVSRVGSVRGLGELGALYELRGRAQVAFARDAETRAFPLCLDEYSHDPTRQDCALDCRFYKQHSCDTIQSTGHDQSREPLSVTDEMSRRSRSRHYRAYGNAADMRNDALRWYRHALECFKAINDSFGIARAASAFATLSLDRMFLETTMTAPQSELMAEGGRATIEDAALASRHALEIAAVINEPLLLLETYLNIAELRHVCDDPLGAIAHWWEARELLLKLLVDGPFIPLATVADAATRSQLRKILERLLRFLAAVADKAMIDENVILFDVFVHFESDVQVEFVQHKKSYCSQRTLGHNHVTVTNRTAHWPRCAPTACDASACWRSIARVRADVVRHRRGKLTLNQVKNRNRNALRELTATMRRLRSMHSETPDPRWLPTAYAIHAAGALIVYAPRMGWRHTLAFGRTDRGLEVASASLIGAFTGARRVVAERNGVVHRRSILKRISSIVSLPCNFFSTALASDRETIATLVCSKRAQVLPWECISDVAISRVLSTTNAANCFAHSDGTRVGSRAFERNFLRHSMELSCFGDMVLHDARDVVDLIVHDLSSPSTSQSDGHYLPNSLTMYPTRNVSKPNGYQSCVSSCSKSVAKHVLMSIPTFVVLPLSMLHAPPIYLTGFQVQYTELLFAPDPVLSHVIARLRSRQCTVEVGACLAKTMSDELALPIVHSKACSPMRMTS